MTWSCRCKKNLLLKELEKGVTLSIRCKTIFRFWKSLKYCITFPLKCVWVFCGCNIFCVDFSLVIISSNCLSCPQDDLSSATLHLLRVDFWFWFDFDFLWVVKKTALIFSDSWTLIFASHLNLILEVWFFTDSALWSFRSDSFWT